MTEYVWMADAFAVHLTAHSVSLPLPAVGNVKSRCGKYFVGRDLLEIKPHVRHCKSCEKRCEREH